MAYAIERDETLPAAIPRLMDEQIVRARETLLDESLPVEKRVHETRKRFKETRALLRLVRDPLGEYFAQENAWFRDAARDLAAARDADAMTEALAKLGLSRTVERRARKALDAQREQHPPLEPIIVNVVEQLVIAQGRIGMWPAFADSFDTIADGLVRTYRGGRNRPDDLHEWRKRVKEHWYHVQLLKNVWPEMMKPYADVLSALAKPLGDHHDLQVLRGVIGDALPVTRAIDARLAELEAQSDAIGARVYAEKADAWLARMRKYWDAWLPTSR
ncbi:MAG TPA: CHAD domain-containing protein [Thermoanaerobaculia bacterium]